MAEGEEAETEEAAASQKKTALVLIHGMGEQRPMETLWGFVEAVWTTDPHLTGDHNRAIYSKPDALIDSFELRRVTTRHARPKGGTSKRVDFFEMYWADLMTGNTVQSFTRWWTGLLIRKPSSVPARLVGPWLAGLASLALTTALLLAAAAAASKNPLVSPWFAKAPAWTLGVLATFSAAFSLVAARWLAPVAGDAARYLSPDPDNVAARQKIRQAGVELIEKLTQSRRYDRIIVVGHSLGAVIAYDVLNVAWGRIATQTWAAVHQAQGPVMQALSNLERKAGELNRAVADQKGLARLSWREAQRAYHAALAMTPSPPWLVSDLVTLGAPLSKADVLMARDKRAFELKRARRELPSNPPWLEKNSKSKTRFSFPFDDPARTPHNGAVFAPVVWTNLYFPDFLIAFGDIISGRVTSLFGAGALDVQLPRMGLAFRHLDYWKGAGTSPAPPWIAPLRKALNLAGLSDDDLWGAEASADEIEVPPSTASTAAATPSRADGSPT